MKNEVAIGYTRYDYFSLATMLWDTLKVEIVKDLVLEIEAVGAGGD